MENNQENIPPVIQPQPPKQLNKKLVVILGSVIICILVIISILFLYQKLTIKSQIQNTNSPNIVTSTDQFPDWKIYIDSKSLFSIKYPPNLYVIGSGQQIFLAKRDETVEKAFENSDQLVEIRTGADLSRFQSYYNTPDKSLVRGYSDLKLKNDIVDGFKAVEYGYDETQKEKEIKQNEDALKSGASVGMVYFNKGLIINKDGTTIEISTNSYSGEFKNTFDQILSTFKLIDQKNQAINISGDKKSIIADGKVIWAINDDNIFNSLKTAENQLCDEKDIFNNPTNDHKMFCEQKSQFENESTFSSIVVSQDGMKIGFTVAGEPSQPDTVVGIFYPNRTTNKLHFLTDYYLDNNFISFSPSGTYFVYKSGCWEGACAFYIANSETLENRRLYFIPENADERGNYEFVKWISDNEIEYKLDGVLIHQLLHTNTDTLPNSSIQGEQCVISSCWGHLGCNYYTCTNGTSTYTKFVD